MSDVTAEEILKVVWVFLITKPKGILILVGTVSIIVGLLYFSSIRAQNNILIDSLKVLQSTAQVTDTIVKKTKEIELKADEATKTIDEKIQKLTEVEDRFKAKRAEIQKLREEQDALLVELQDKLKKANDKLDKIDKQQANQQVQQKEIQMMYEKTVSGQFFDDKKMSPAADKKGVK